MRIGSISVHHVTVADDLAFLACNQEETQVMVWDVENNASRERYLVNPSKNHVVRYSRNMRKVRDTDTFMYK